MAFIKSKTDGSLKGYKMSLSARSLNYSTCPRLSFRSYDSSITSARHVNSDEFFENLAPQDCSSENNEKFGNMSETQSDIVPPLDIKSEENYPTTRGYTFSYRKHCESDKIALKPDKAFETWLSAKRKLLFDEAVRRKKEKELKQKLIEQRKLLAKEKYDNWMQKKSQASIRVPSNTSIPTKKSVENNEIRKRSLSAEETQVRLEEWERAKRLEKERRRMLQQEKEQQRRDMVQQRRQMATAAWENWILNSNKKPKPVPLNRGIFTLRGTVSDIFVNPNEWKSIIPLKNEEN